MSWDVALIRTKTNAEPLENIDHTNLECFLLDEVAETLEAHLAGIEKADPTWLDYETCDYAVSFQLAPEEIVLSIHLLTDDGEGAVMALIGDLCAWLDCRAIDRTENEFIEI